MSNSYFEHFLNEYDQNMQDISERLFKDNSHIFNQDYLGHFIRMGRALYEEELVSTHGGNMSIADTESIWITRHGASLGFLEPEDVIMASWDPAEDDELVSSEMDIHHAIYQGEKEYLESQGLRFATMSIIHVHSPHAIARSMMDDKIWSFDHESRKVLGNYTKVIQPVGHHDPEDMTSLFRNFAATGKSVFMLKGHGTVAIGKTMHEAHRLVSMLERTAQLINIYESTGRKFEPPVCE